MAWSLLLLKQVRDWRMGFLTAMLALMALRQALTLRALLINPNVSFPVWGTPSELPGLVVSVLAALAVFFLHRMLREQRQAAEAFREQEKKLLQAQKMEAIGTLAGGVAHDFNNLLTAIRGNAELATASLPEDHEVQELLDEIRTVSDRAADLTKRILAFSSKKPARLSVQDPGRVLTELAPVLRRLVPENIELSFLPGDAPDKIQVDRAQLEQVLVNLAVNACDVMPEGGKIVISVETIELAATPGEPPRKFVRFSVKDNGPGMSEEVQSRLFEPFFTTKPPGKGTGLGLSTSYTIVQSVGGEITVQSGTSGTTFHVSVPACDSTGPDTTHPSPTPRIVGGHERVLLVEDEPGVRAYVVRALECAGYQIEAFANGADALRYVETGSGVDVLVSDVVMPQMSGPELVASVKRFVPNIGVVLMSGYPQRLDKDLSIGDEVLLLTKPFTTDQLKQALRKVIDSSRANKAGQRLSRPEGRSSQNNRG